MKSSGKARKLEGLAQEAAIARSADPRLAQVFT